MTRRPLHTPQQLPITPSRRRAAARAAALVTVVWASLGCVAERSNPAGQGAAGTPAVRAFTGALLFDGTGADPVADAVLVMREGRVIAAGPAAITPVPDGAEVIDVTGSTIIPGIINAHGHVGQADGLEQGEAVHTRENILEQLALYARYGVTTVVSLGEPGYEGVAVRDAQRANPAAVNRARLYVAGTVMNPRTPAEAEATVAERAGRRVDWAKIRVDDFLGSGSKMSRATYSAVIQAAEARGLPLTAHMVELEDARGLVRAGAAVLGHSVRDAPVDAELIALMRERDVCLHPTLTRELSTFIYADRPAFFDDPFFLREADPAVLTELERPERQARYRDAAAAYFRAALPTAERNLIALHQAGVRIAFGTDSGPPARFQGYFEHLELEMMQDAGMAPVDILLAATRDAAACMRLDGLGTLTPGNWADFVVLERNPLEDVRHTRTIQSVWISGAQIPDR